MRLCDVGWCWEGQGLDPGVHPTVLGVGDGARYFGLKRCQFLYHPTTDLALQKLSDMDEVVCDISKWLLRDASRGGSESYVEGTLERVCEEAELVSKFSVKYRNITGAVHDDMLGLLRRSKFGADQYGQVVAALKKHNPDMKLWCVLYEKELDPKNWEGMQPYIDYVNLWRWNVSDEPTDSFVAKCREIFPDKPIYLGVYLRSYAKRQPRPISALEQRFNDIVRHLDEGNIAGFEILGTILIDGQIEQAEWIRDFIAKHS